MISKLERDEALSILSHMLTALTSGLAVAGRPGANLRQAIGNLHADIADLIKGGTLGDEILACFELAREAGATLVNMDSVRKAMLAEAPYYGLGIALKLSGLVFSLSEQCQMITGMTFVSRGDAEKMMVKMMTIADEVKLETSELINGQNYQDVVTLSAALAQHLGITERQLPRIVSYKMLAVLPSLTISNLLYSVGDRSEELIAENNVIHPAFMPRDIIALSDNP